MLSEQLTPQQKEDGLLLKERLLEPKVWAALQRIMAQVEQSTFDRFEQEKEKKSWLRGARTIIKELLPTIIQKIEDSETAVQEEDHEQKILHGESAEGSSDLALG